MMGWEFLETQGNFIAFNLGNKEGYSNMQIVEAVKRNTPLKPNVTRRKLLIHFLYYH